MKLRRSVWSFCFCALLGRAAAVEWDIRRFEGRDYVTLENIAAFYGFPKPAPVSPPTPAEVAAIVAGAASATEFGITTAATLAAASRTIALDSGAMHLEVTPGLSEVNINGVKQWLAFPVRLEDGRALVSRLDLSKIIEPRLRPELIAGLQPVTTVVLDPGHGGHDRGAVSRFGFEKDFALDVALRARPLLEKAGYKVVMTRATDIFIPLEERPAIANRIPNSIFVSIHFNSSSSNADARGFEIFSIAPRGAPATNDSLPSERDLREEPGNAVELPSGALAGSVFHALLGQVPMVDRGLKHARFAVLRLCERPAVLVECGFVSNPTESSLISSGSWRARIAEAVVDGVEDYRALAETKHRPRVLADYRRAAAGHPQLRDTATP
jgi:N-acetylmuramoyl-L-alanine amidase